MKGAADAAPTRLGRGLMLIAAAFMVVNVAALTLARGETRLSDWGIVGVWIGSALVGSAILERALPHRDPLLFPLALFMSGWGLIAIARLAPVFADRQAIWLIVSTAALIIVAVIPNVLRLVRAFRYTLLVVGLALLIGTILLGTNPSGQVGAPELWLGFGTVFFQPSEPLKIILVAFLASYLAEQYPALRAEGIDAGKRRAWSLSPRIAGPILLMWGISIVVLVWQRDLGTAILFFLVFLTLLYVASGYTPLLIGGAGLVATAGIVAYQLFAVVRLRVDIWLNPWLEAEGRAYQIVQSLMAFSAGGVFGQGVNQGAPGYVPVVHSDFIFAAIAEEWGFLGVIVVIAGFAVMITRGLHIAVAQDGRPFQTLLAVGLTAVLGVQTLMIMGGVLKLVPLTGVTLPFFSYGGSSLLISYVLIGLLLRLSAEGADA
ncbi:MAG: FtsW/RodA/SpoVE family cell cycle protein [Chloroflexota bacterium]|nr:FtsW/RodA/SpoVE family cell cycle protein [Chloroflexota bacterium]